MIEEENSVAQTLHKEVTETLERNRLLLENVYASVEKTRKYILWIKVMNIIKLALIVVMGIVVSTFLSSSLKDVLKIYTGGGI